MVMRKPPKLSEALTAMATAMDRHKERYPTPFSNCYVLSSSPDQPLQHHEHSNSSVASHFEHKANGWLAVNADVETIGRAKLDEDGDYDMDFDKFLDEDETFDDELDIAASGERDDEYDLQKDAEQILDNSPHRDHLNGVSHARIITTATKTCPSLLTPNERLLLAKIKSKKDEAALGFPSPTHGYNTYLGPSCLRNATFDRLASFMNSTELAKIVVENTRSGSEEWRLRKARALMGTLYARAIREKETEAILRECEKQEKEREEMRRDKEVRFGVKSTLYASYEIQVEEEEEVVSLDDLMKVGLEKKTEGMSPVERRGYLRKVYGARWTWYASNYGLHIVLEPNDVLVRS
jgi:hypothetical protein